MHEMVIITMTVADEDFTLRSCSSCDLRWWDGPGGAVGLPSVLALVAGAGR